MVVTFLGWRELMRCVGARYGDVPAQRLFPALAALGITGGLTGSAFGAFLGIAVAAWGAAILPMLRTGRPVPMASMLSMGLGSVLVSVPVTHLLLLVQLDYGAFAFLILLINGHDGFSVGFGRLLGRHRLCPHISPGKTWEGAAGGLVVCLVIASLVDFLVPTWPHWQVWLAAALVAALALLGDLVASSLKREAGIKDFGTSLPGMGGVLDRFDGLLFIAPMFYAFVRLTGSG